MQVGWLVQGLRQGPSYIFILNGSHSFKFSLPPNVLLSKLHSLYYTKIKMVRWLRKHFSY